MKKKPFSWMLFFLSNCRFWLLFHLLCFLLFFCPNKHILRTLQQIQIHQLPKRPVFECLWEIRIQKMMKKKEFGTRYVDIFGDSSKETNFSSPSLISSIFSTGMFETMSKTAGILNDSLKFAFLFGSSTQMNAFRASQGSNWVENIIEFWLVSKFLYFME